MDHQPETSSGLDGSRTHLTDLAGVSRLLGTCQPVESEVRPGVEPGLPPYRGGVLPKHLQTVSPRVIPGGVEPPLSWLSPRRLRRWTTGSFFSDRGGSRTHRHEALDLAAMPICVPGRKWRVRELHPAVQAYETRLSLRPPAVAGPGIEPGAPAATNLRSVPEASWAPAAPAMSSDQGESRTPKPEGHDVLNVARLPVAPLGHVEQPVRELNPPHQIEGLVSYADRRTGRVVSATSRS